MEAGGEPHTPTALFPEKRPLVLEVEWAPGSLWTGAENLACPGIRSPGREARNQSLC
jgi:hypothetical protein